MSSSALSTLTRSLSNLSFLQASKSSSQSTRWVQVAKKGSILQMRSHSNSNSNSHSNNHSHLCNTKSLSKFIDLHSSTSSPSFTIRQFSSEEKKSSADDPDSEWHKFQKTLRFDTMDENAASSNVKKRGGKVLRKKKERELELLKKQEGRVMDVGTGQFPPLRYTDKETDKLLAEAYAALPKKGISKKTRQKKRQKNRFKAIRRARYIKKQEKIAHHFATMEHRSTISKQIRKVVDGAVEVRNEDVEYQRKVLKKWAMIQGLGKDGEDGGDAIIGEGGTKQEI